MYMRVVQKVMIKHSTEHSKKNYLIFQIDSKPYIISNTLMPSILPPLWTRMPGLLYRIEFK